MYYSTKVTMVSIAVMVIIKIGKFGWTFWLWWTYMIRIKYWLFFLTKCLCCIYLTIKECTCFDLHYKRQYTFLTIHDNCLPGNKRQGNFSVPEILQNGGPLSSVGSHFMGQTHPIPNLFQSGLSMMRHISPWFISPSWSLSKTGNELGHPETVQHKI